MTRFLAGALIVLLTVLVVFLNGNAAPVAVALGLLWLANLWTLRQGWLSSIAFIGFIILVAFSVFTSRSAAEGALVVLALATWQLEYLAGRWEPMGAIPQSHLWPELGQLGILSLAGMGLYLLGAIVRISFSFSIALWLLVVTAIGLALFWARISNEKRLRRP